MLENMFGAEGGRIRFSIFVVVVKTFSLLGLNRRFVGPCHCSGDIDSP